MRRRKIILGFSALLLTVDTMGGHPRNIILCIGDGMGSNHVQAAHYYLGTNLVFETFPYQSAITTHSANAAITDSAAAATAMATGKRVNNYVLSLDLPGDSSELETILEYYRDQGKSTGLVTTSYITHATPAAFGAHETSRNNYEKIAEDYFSGSHPNVLFGGGGESKGVTNTLFEAAGYSIATNAIELFAFNPASNSHFAGFFSTDHMPYENDGLGDLPHLHEMTAVALDILDNDPDGFFLMMEGARIDHAGHANNIVNTVHETTEFAGSVQTILDWMGGRTDTLLIVTADHETGGLSVTSNGITNYPSASWASTCHTCTPVPVYATGLNASFATNVADITDIHGLLKSSAKVPENLITYTIDAANIETVWTAYSNDTYRLEQAFTLTATNWTAAGTVTATTSRLLFSTPLSTSSNQVFYRLISE